jgi:hypothetical protein
MRVSLPVSAFTFSDKVEKEVRRWLIGGRSGDTRRYEMEVVNAVGLVSARL